MKSKFYVVIQAGQNKVVYGGLNLDTSHVNYGQPWQSFLIHFIPFSYNPKEGEQQVKVWEPGTT